MAAKKPPRSTDFRFSATIVRAGIMYCVDVPAAVSRAIGVRGYVAVVGTVDGVALRGSLSPKGGGRHRVTLNGQVRRAAGAALGDRVEVRMRVDRDPPEWPTPEDLADALRDEGALEAFMAITRGRRNHIIAYLEKAVHETTRAKRVARIVEIALAEREKRMDRASEAGEAGVDDDLESIARGRPRADRPSTR